MKLVAPKRIIPVILSGGNGTRLWPVSRDDRPKQFFNLLDSQRSIMQKTLMRVSDPSLFAPPLVVGVEQHRFLIADQLKEVGIAAADVIIEPCGRNTAPAIAIAAHHIAERYQEALMLVLPTDQHIVDYGSFLKSVKRAAKAAVSDHLVTFGVIPEYPETGYGYIRRGDLLGDGHAFRVDSFVEKPDRKTAEQYVSQKEYFWNSGMFLFSSRRLLEEIEQCNPIIARMSREAYAKCHKDLNFIRPDEECYKKMPSISIDYAVMEPTQHAAIVPLDCGWSDIGAWETFWRLSDKDERSNAIIGECYSLESSNCYLRSEDGRAIATYGIDNLVVVAAQDVVLVTTKEHTQSLKTLVAHVRERNPGLVARNCKVFRPWGMYESLNNGQRYQVKHISVNPGEKLSLQMHHHRSEHWVVVSGTAKVVCGDKEHLLTENQSVYIPLGSVHRIENPGKIPLHIIEVQSGAYLGEDDIVRLEDQYGRTPQASPVKTTDTAAA